MDGQNAGVAIFEKKTTPQAINVKSLSEFV